MAAPRGGHGFGLYSMTVTVMSRLVEMPEVGSKPTLERVRNHGGRLVEVMISAHIFVNIFVNGDAVYVAQYVFVAVQKQSEFAIKRYARYRFVVVELIFDHAKPLQNAFTATQQSGFTVEIQADCRTDRVYLR